MDLAVLINDLPEELIEHILLNLSPYNDLKGAMLVCRKWHRLVKGVIKQQFQNFQGAVSKSQIGWHGVANQEFPGIALRYSHCACYYDKSLYIFGGCTSTSTTFNDLWRFDLASRHWIRPLAMGTYPSPKACATMVVYKDRLALFGGWSHPSPYPLHQAAKFFSELHMYWPATSRWSHQLTPFSPPPTAGHSACVLQDRMLVFGGCQRPGVGSDDVWMYSFTDIGWQKKQITGAKPSPRYGQSQVVVDDDHILIVGGCGGPNCLFSDVWLLDLSSEMWSWTEIKINNPTFSPPKIWCHPACRVGSSVVVLSKLSHVAKQWWLSLMKDTDKQKTKANKCVTRSENVTKPAASSPEEMSTDSSSTSPRQSPSLLSPRESPADELPSSPATFSENSQVPKRNSYKRRLAELSRSQESTSSDEGPDWTPPRTGPSDMSPDWSVHAGSGVRWEPQPGTSEQHNDASRLTDRTSVWPHRLSPSDIALNAACGHNVGCSNATEQQKSDYVLPNGASLSLKPDDNHMQLSINNIDSESRFSTSPTENLPNIPASREPVCLPVDCSPADFALHTYPERFVPFSDESLGAVGGVEASGSVPSEHVPLLSHKDPPSPTALRTLSPRPGLPSVRPNSMRNRQKQLETLQRYEQKLKRQQTRASSTPSLPAPSSSSNSCETEQIPIPESGLVGAPKMADVAAGQPAPSRAENSLRRVPSPSRPSLPIGNVNMGMCSTLAEPRHPMYIHILDISRVVSDLEVTWRSLPEQPSMNSPEETMFYSLAEGRGELLMFGGMQRGDLRAMQRGVDIKSIIVSNALYFLSPDYES